MKIRSAACVLAGVAALSIALALASGMGMAQVVADRISFVIGTGSTTGTYFPVGQAIAAVVSHPPGVDRCRRPSACGPLGLIASVRTSDGTVANVMAVNARRFNAGLAQSDVVAEALAGQGAFAKLGKQSHIRIAAGLFPEYLHLVAARSAHVTSVSDLRGKRVAASGPSSGTAVTARAVLRAFRLPERSMRLRVMGPDAAAAALEAGKLDAFFFVGGTPVSMIQYLLGRGVAEIVPITGKGRDRLLRNVPALSAGSIAAHVYGNNAAIETVSMRALLLVNDAEPENVVHDVVRALFDPANVSLLRQGHLSARYITLKNANRDLVGPLHPGAARFYREAGVIAR